VRINEGMKIDKEKIGNSEKQLNKIIE